MAERSCHVAQTVSLSTWSVTLSARGLVEITTAADKATLYITYIHIYIYICILAQARAALSAAERERDRTAGNNNSSSSSTNNNTPANLTFLARESQRWREQVLDAVLS